MLSLEKNLDIELLKRGERKAIVSLVQDGSISITKGAEKLAISIQEIERLMESSVKVR